VDAGPPDSQILPNFTFVDSTAYTVVWSGTDDMNGSGIKDYSIYVSDTSDIITEWLSNTSDSSAIFYGEYGNSYKFYCISRDHVNNIEKIPNSFDALLSVERSISEIPLDVFPNPIDQSAYIKYTLTERVDLNLSILNMNGQVVQMLVNESQSAGNYTIILDTMGMIPGTYICRIIAGTKSPFIQSSQRIMVK